MKIFLCGQRSFGAAVCKALLEAGHEIVGVSTAPPGRRREKLYAYAALKRLPLAPDGEKLVSAHMPAETDLIVAAHSRWIISDQCLQKARYGGIGFHPSLLPRHRGKDAVRWAIHMGDFISGGTVYRLSDKTDSGEILRQEPVWIVPGWTYHDLWNAIFPVGVKLISQAVKDIERGETRPIGQDERCATWEPSWDRPRLERKELLALGGVSPVDCDTPKECRGCDRDCTWCTYNIAAPELYYKR